jgi:dolichyl-diphosphooligosaccharide--protein glycosyltransferase
MSKRFDEFAERLSEHESQINSIYDLYHLPVLAALMAFMLWNRVRNYANHIGPDGQPLYQGNDPYYHYRATRYTIENYPFTIPFDPWTGFDVGTRTGQFGTLFDQAAATVALVVGLGSPSQATIVTTTLVMAPMIATLCAIPMYYIGKRLGGRFGGIIAVVVLALSPGQFLSRSVAGSFDHQIAEVIFTLLAITVAMKLLSVAQREQPIYEFIQTREFEELREPAKWGAVLGVVLTLAALNWPPAIFLFGVFGAFLFVILSVEFVRGHSPDHVTIPWVVAMVTFVVLFAPFIKAFRLTPTDYSLAHPLLAVAVAGGAIFMAVVARLWEQRDLQRNLYPLGILGAGAVGVAVLAVAAPDVLDFFVSQFNRVAGLGSSDSAATISEARAPGDPIGLFYQSYGLGFFSAVAGFGLLLYHVLSRDRPRADHLLVAMFGVFLLLFTLTQGRFEIHFVTMVGAGNAYIVGWIYQFVDLENVKDDLTTVKPYQVLIVIAVLFVVAGPLVVTGSTLGTANAASQPGEMQYWGESLDWLSEETPELGTYGSGGNPSLEYNGRYEITDDFQYGAGDYGVLAWWDYGHYITTRGERIPVANPFQQNAGESADFLLAGNETNATRILEEDSPEGEGVRYVMVDYQLGYVGTQKYNAPTAFESEHGIGTGDIGISVYQENDQTGQRQRAYGVHTQRGYESMRVRLYQFHGSAQEAGRVTVNLGPYDEANGIARLPEDIESVNDLYEQHDSVEAAREAAETDPTVVHGGIFGQPAERVEALEHFRLVHAGGPRVQSTFDRAVSRRSLGGADSWVKTFERVDGATVEGSAPANTEVRASVQMKINSTGETFVYTQYADTDENGNFEMTLPYSTTDYDEYGPENGHTNVAVRANTSYQFVAPDGAAIAEADVTEAQVLGDDETPVTVDLQRLEVESDSGNVSTNGAMRDAGVDTDGSSDDGTQEDTIQGQQATRAS